MNKVVAISTLALLAIIGLSAYAYTVYLPSLSGSSQAGPGSGTLNIYLSDPPPSSPNLKYLLVNVTSVTIKYSSNVTSMAGETSSASGASSSGATTSAVSSASSTSSAVSSTSTITSPSTGSGFVDKFVYNVSASVGTNVNLTKLQGSSVLLGTTKVPSGNVTGIILHISGAKAFWTDGTSSQLMVVADGKLMVNVHFTIQPTGSTNLSLDISPGEIHVSPGQVSVLRPVIHVSAISSGSKGTQTVETTVTESESSSSTA